MLVVRFGRGVLTDYRVLSGLARLRAAFKAHPRTAGILSVIDVNSLQTE